MKNEGLLEGKFPFNKGFTATVETFDDAVEYFGVVFEKTTGKGKA